MNLKKIAYVIFILFLISFSVNGQTPVSIDKKEFKYNSDDDAFKLAWQSIKAGDEAFAAGSAYYHIALKYYLEAVTYNAKNPELNYKLGICYLFSPQKEKAVAFLEKASEKPDLAPDFRFWLGKAYHANYEFDKAIEQYEKFVNSLPPKLMQQFEAEVGEPILLIENCRNSKELVGSKLNIFVDNVGSSVNTAAAEYSPLISADESLLIFTSRRENTTGGNRSLSDNEFFEDIYFSKIGKNGEWLTALNIGDKVNTKEHDATVNLTADGQKLIIYRSSSGNGDLFESKLNGNEWSKPRQYSKSLNTKYHEASACLSPDEQTIYFVSDNPSNNYGKHDIFKATLNKNGDWDNIENLGNVVNTKLDEISVFLHPDGRTLYFSSEGHNSMGGYDIFSTTLQENGTWSKPENIGNPINTPNNEVFFVISGNGKHGYFASNQVGGKGETDIYRITFLGEPKPALQSNEDNLMASLTIPIKEKTIEKAIEIKKIRLTILKGIIADSITNQPLEAQIEIVDNLTGKLISSFTSNSTTGKYLIPLPSGFNYGIAVKKDQYLFHSENVDIPNTTGYQEINKDIKLLKFLKGSGIILRNIFFDTGKSILREESNTELNRLWVLLNENPSLKIEIQGHTDNVGGLEYNNKLSTSRSKAVVDYLIGKGIDSNRLTFKGYGYSKPLTTNETPEGRQINRRVQFQIL